MKTEAHHGLVLRHLHEVLFAMTIAFGAVSVLFLTFPGLSGPFVHLEVSINRVLHLRQTDLIRGYFEFLIPSCAVAFCLWLLLRLSSRTNFTEQLLRSAAGIAVLSVLPVFWLYLSQTQGLSFGWPYRGWPLELAAAIVIAILFLRGRTALPSSLLVLLLAAHFSFWFWIRGNFQLANFAGPIAPVLAFMSSVAWVFYVQQARRVDARPV